MLYLVVGTLSTTLQLLLVLGIFAAQDRVADEILAADSTSGMQHFERWASIIWSRTEISRIAYCMVIQACQASDVISHILW